MVIQHLLPVALICCDYSSDRAFNPTFGPLLVHIWSRFLVRFSSPVKLSPLDRSSPPQLLRTTEKLKQAASTGPSIISSRKSCYRSGNGRSVLGIPDLLNSDGSSPLLDELKSDTKSPLPPPHSCVVLAPAPTKVTKLRRSKVHPSLLRANLLVKIALRSKSTPKRANEHYSSKLHLKLLEAGLRVRLILCPSMYELYRQLTPNNARNNSLVSVYFSEDDHTLLWQDILRVLKAHRGYRMKYPTPPHSMDALSTPISGSEDRLSGLVTPEGVTEDHPYLLYSGKSQSRRVRLIDSNLVNISSVSNKVLKTFTQNNPLHASEPINKIVSTFNQLDTAVSSLFNIQQYSLVRVTRSASSSTSGFVLMKLETARTGDYSLIDDLEFMDDMLASLGSPGQSPNNIFIKKIVARPRYKSDMKIYIIPSTHDILLYADERSFERDLINGVIDMDCPPQRKIFTTFPVEEVLARVRNHLDMSKNITDIDFEPVENHMYGDIPQDTSSLDDSVPADSPSSSLSGSLSTSLSLPSMSSSLINTESSSVSTPSTGDIQYIPDVKTEPNQQVERLKFDTDYSA